MALGGDPKSPSIKMIKRNYYSYNTKIKAKKRAGPANKRYGEYLAWLKASRIKAAKIQKEYKSAMKALADETTRRHKDYVAKYAEWEEVRRQV